MRRYTLTNKREKEKSSLSRLSQQCVNTRILQSFTKTTQQDGSTMYTICSTADLSSTWTLKY